MLMLVGHHSLVHVMALTQGSSQFLDADKISPPALTSLLRGNVQPVFPGDALGGTTIILPSSRG